MAQKAFQFLNSHIQSIKRILKPNEVALGVRGLGAFGRVLHARATRVRRFFRQRDDNRPDTKTQNSSTWAVKSLLRYRLSIQTGATKSKHQFKFRARPFIKRSAIGLLALACFLSGWPPILTHWIPNASALTNVSIKNGYYMGDGSSGHAITGLGFAPEYVLIKADTSAGAAAFKTNLMPTNSMAVVTATSDNTGSNLVLNSDGFTLGTSASVNSLMVRYNWVAFAGSDCSSNGIMCIGQYTGNGSSPRNITTGFQPDYVKIKRTTAVAPHFHTASQPTNESLYFMNTVRDTSGNFIRSFSSTAFTVGSSDNASGGTYNYIAFRNSTGVFAEGTYAGDGTGGRDITGFGFTPDIAFVKNATNATAANTRTLMRTNSVYGNNTVVLTATGNTTNGIQTLQSDGMKVGSNVYSNGSGDTYYWFGFGGATPAAAIPGSHFTMATGSLSGNGTSQSVSSLGFQPDMVMIKDNSTSYQAYRTSMMKGDITYLLASPVAGFTGGITSLDSDGFSVGADTSVNGSGRTYQWQAFGNAWNPETGTGSTDFTVGVYNGDGADDRDITGLPWQPDMVSVRRDGPANSAWRSSEMSGDTSGYFNALADGSDLIQTINSDGFQVGSLAIVNTNNSWYFWFAFKTSDNFAVGSYTGNSFDNRNISSVGWQPEFVMVKRSQAYPGVNRSNSLIGDTSQFFRNDANASNLIQSLTSNGFQLGSDNDVNDSGGLTRWMAWRNQPPPIVSVTITTDASVDFGVMASNSTKSTLDLTDTQVAENDGNVAADFNIKTDEPAGWTLGSSTGSDIFVYEFSDDGGSNWIKFITPDSYQSLATNIAASATQSFDLRITTPTFSTADTLKTITITVQAVQH